MIDYSKCPACNGKRRELLTGGVYRCKRCEALFGETWLGETYRFVKPWMTTADVPAERLRYFDFLTVGSEGIRRRHGWYDKQTGCIVQVG
jgi:hypothetical protein